MNIFYNFLAIQIIHMPGTNLKISAKSWFSAEHDYLAA